MVEVGEGVRLPPWDLHVPILVVFRCRDEGLDVCMYVCMHVHVYKTYV